MRTMTSTLAFAPRHVSLKNASEVVTDLERLRSVMGFPLAGLDAVGIARSAAGDKEGIILVEAVATLIGDNA